MSRRFTGIGSKFVSDMQFGKLPSIDQMRLDDFELPETMQHQQDVSSLSDSERDASIRIGGTTWNIPEWVGTTYPTKTPKRLFPEAYGRQFGTIEFNATHYRIYSPEKMQEWARATPTGFKFCPKFPQIISHFRRFVNCEGPTDDFINGLMALGDRRGPAFIQLPPHFAPKHAEAMWAYLKQWPRELQLSIEFRHPDWFAGPQPHWERMSQLGIGAVISDTAGRRDALHMAVTASHVVVRFGGYEGHPIDQFRLGQWADWIAQSASLGVREYYLLVHEPDSIHTPQTCRNFTLALKDGLRRNTVVPKNLSMPETDVQPRLF